MIKKDGFTLIELIVAMAVMAILSTIILANFRSGNKAKAVTLATDTVLSGLRTAQDSSLNPKSIASIACVQSKIPTEYIVKFDSSKPNSLDFSAANRCDSTLTKVQTFLFPTGVKIKLSRGLAVKDYGIVGTNVDVGAAGGIMEIKFIPPFGKMLVSVNGGGYKGFGSSEITLESTDGTVTKKILLDGISGRINVK